MRNEKCLKSSIPLLLLVSSLGLTHAVATPTGQLWFGTQGPFSETSTGVSDNRVGYVDSDGFGLTTVEVDATNITFYSVGVDVNDNLCFALASDGSLRSARLNAVQFTQTYSGTGLSSLEYEADYPGDARYVPGTPDIVQLYTEDAGLAFTADAPAVFIPGPFGKLSTFSASYDLLSSSVPPGTSPYWILQVSPPGNSNPSNELTIIEASTGPGLNGASTIHVYDPNGVVGTYSGYTLSNLDSVNLGSYTFGDMTVDSAGVEIGNWGVNDGIGASAEIESLSIGSAPPGILDKLQITDLDTRDLAYSFAVDTVHHFLYLGLWGNDASGADMIEVPYNPANGVMTSPYDSTTGSITNEAGVFMSFDSTGQGFVMAREMWLTPDGSQIYYVDNDFGDPGFFAGGVQLNGVYVVNTGDPDPQPQMLSLYNQFPGNNSQGSIIGLAVNLPKNLIYFATGGPAPGVNTSFNTLWWMPITGGEATAMPLPQGLSLVYPNAAGGCLALDTNAQVLYVSDEGRGTIMQLALSADGTNFTTGNASFFTLDPDHLTDGANGFPSAFVQGLEFVPFVVAPQLPQLTIVRQGNDAVISWPSQFSNYTLQYASLLASKAWSAYGGPFFTNSTSVIVTNEISAGGRFYRLSN